MAYSKHTCKLCGMRKPQPYMQQFEYTREVGRSKESLTAGTIFGAVLGNQSSVNKVGKRLWANNQRKYHRNYIGWRCYPGQCHMTASEVDDYLQRLAANRPTLRSLWNDFVEAIISYTIAGLILAVFLGSLMLFDII